MALSALQANPPEKPRPFCAPTLAPGVIPENAKGDSGYVALDSASCQDIYRYLNAGPMCGLGFPGYQYLSELAQRSEYRSPSETMAKEMTRGWIELSARGDKDVGDKLDHLTAALERFQIRAWFEEAALHDGYFGRAQLAILIKGQMTDERRKLPLMISPEGIKKDSLLGFKTVEPVWTTPYSYNSTDPLLADFYKPTAWYILGKQTHASRLLSFISREVPDILKPSYNFGGISMSQLMEPYVKRWLSTADGVNRLINNYSILILLTNMQATLQDEGAAGLINRARAFTLSRDNQGLMMLDKESEDIKQVAVPLSGLSDLQAQAQEHMAAPSHIPLVKLFGITPTGLNASSEGEIQVFYDYVLSMQESIFRPNLKAVLDILQLNEFGVIDEDITFTFVPLKQMDGTELAHIRKSDADAGVAYINSGVIDADEERERIQRDPNSGYMHLEGSAPEPPELEEPDNAKPVKPVKKDD